MDVHDDVFLLFEDTKKTHKGVSFSRPLARIHTSSLKDVERCFGEIGHWQNRGCYVAGYMSYEAGWAFVTPQCQTECPSQFSDYPLLDFYVFSTAHPVQNIQDVKTPATLYNFRALTDFEKYSKDLDVIFDHLKKGDTYQVNYTLRTQFDSTVDPWETYQTLRRLQRVEYSAFIGLEDLHILSFSPELFLKKRGRRLFTKPMKGTISRSPDSEQDHYNKNFLQKDPKSRAENVMIVDLLRNDMGRIAKAGTVTVPEIFQVEDYETVFQMISAIECEIPETTTNYEIFKALFPCGSITGAPKLRTMQLIDRLEQQPRGVYTGTVGYFEPNGDFCFNVSIRTLVKENQKSYEVGTGGGILISSDVGAEYKESLLKRRYLAQANHDFYIFETFLYDGNVFKNLDEHVARLHRSAEYFSFSCDTEKIYKRLEELHLNQPHRVKIQLWNDGSLDVEIHGLTVIPKNPKIYVYDHKVESTDLFLNHKTSQRSLYDQAYSEAQEQGFYDVVFLNEHKRLTEASRHNLFIKLNEQWLTPPLSEGVLPGVERARTIKDLGAKETPIYVRDLQKAQEILLTNSVRGRVPVVMGELS